MSTIKTDKPDLPCQLPQLLQLIAFQLGRDVQIVTNPLEYMRPAFRERV